QAMGAEAADRHERVALTDRAAVLHQAGHDQPGGNAGNVGEQLRERHLPAHCAPPVAGIAAPPAARARLASSAACAASQVSMSSGGTSISRSAPSMTRANSGA